MVIDAMGHYSPIVKQLRKDQEPSSVCMVVGGSASYNNAQKGLLSLLLQMTARMMAIKITGRVFLVLMELPTICLPILI